METRFFKYKNEERFVAIMSSGSWILIDQWKDNCDFSIGSSPDFCEKVIQIAEEIDRHTFFSMTRKIETRLFATLNLFKNTTKL